MKRTVHALVDRSFYDKMEKARIKFMKKTGIKTLTTTKFTSMPIIKIKLDKEKNVKVKKR